MKKLISLIFICGFVYTQSGAQRVSPIQGGAYQPGLLNVRDYTAFDPGLYFYDYSYWNNSNAFYNQFGDKVSGIEIDMTPINPEAGIKSLSFEPQVSGYTNIPFIFYVSKLKIFEGSYIASISPGFVTSNSNMYVNTTDTSIYNTGNSGGFGDFEFMPFGLSWSFNKKVDVSFLYSIYVPTGRYKTGADNNVGKGYWTHQFQVPFYLYFFEQTMALALVPTFEINGKVKDADVRPGSRLTIEYGISQFIISWLEVEFLNGHNWQITDDKGEDLWWKESPLYTKDQTSTFSFGIGAWPWQGRFGARLKYARDYGSKQRYRKNFWTLSFLSIPKLLN